MRITYYYRPRTQGVFSIETLFDAIVGALPVTLEKEVFVCTHKWKRYHSYFAARKFQGQVNHITGDIHEIAFFLDKKRTILTVHDIGRYERDLTGLKKKLKRLIWLFLPLRRVRLITTISEFTKSKLIQECGIRPDKIKVIYNPANTDFAYREKEFDEQSPVVLQIGSGNNKNLARLIEAVQGTSFRLLLIRKPDKQLEEKLNEANIKYEWRFNISREEVYACYQKADILFFASEYEGFGVPILEANAVGRPVITSNLASMPEVAGDAAILVNPFDVKEIKMALYKLKEEPEFREQLIRKGRANLERFQPEVIANEYLTLYNSITSRSK